jgi:hypothetical protein
MCFGSICENARKHFTEEGDPGQKQDDSREDLLDLDAFSLDEGA